MNVIGMSLAFAAAVGGVVATMVRDTWLQNDRAWTDTESVRNSLWRKRIEIEEHANVVDQLVAELAGQTGGNIVGVGMWGERFDPALLRRSQELLQLGMHELAMLFAATVPLVNCWLSGEGCMPLFVYDILAKEGRRRARILRRTFPVMP